MRTVTLRGEKVGIDDVHKRLYFEIVTPRGSVFSLSDRIVHYLTSGYQVFVKLPTHTMIVNPGEKPFKEEVVPSKFEGYEPWYRYWFMIKGGKTDTPTIQTLDPKPEPPKQLDMFGG